MNNFAKAHKLTKEVIQAGDNYAATFTLCLKHIIKTEKENTMHPELKKMVEQVEARIVEIEAFKASKPSGYIVVTGSKMAMPIKFSDNYTKVGVTNVENATRFETMGLAKVKATPVRNGAGEAGRVVHIMIQIEHELTDQHKLLNDLKNM